MTASGKFAWHTLMTRDGEAASAFYSDLLGWSVTEGQMGRATYRICMAGEDPVADIVQTEDEDIPVFWVSYVRVDDVEATVERAGQLGGEIVVTPTTLPDVGTFAVIQDPQGAHISVFSAWADTEDPPDDWAQKPGHFGWTELLTTDIETGKAFYNKLIGWEVHRMPMGQMGTYTLFRSGNQDRAGGMNLPKGAQTRPHWLPYITVDGVDQSLGLAKRLGARVLAPPRDIPTVGRLATLADPTGAVFAIAAWAKRR